MNNFYRILIVVGAIVLFVVTYLLNKKMPVPNNIKEEDLPEKCLKCTSSSCGIKLDDNKQKVNNLEVDRLIKECEEKDHEQQK